MKPSRHSWRPFLLLLASLGMAGCLGYRVGNVAHPQLHTLAIAEVANDTVQPGLSAILAERLRSTLVTDGSLRLAPGAGSGATLHCRILSYSFAAEGAAQVQSSDSSLRTYATNSFSVLCTVEYTVTVPHQNQPLLGPRQVTGRALFEELGDLEITRREAFRQALSEAAQKIVKDVVEAW